MEKYGDKYDGTLIPERQTGVKQTNTITLPARLSSLSGDKDYYLYDKKRKFNTDFSIVDNIRKMSPSDIQYMIKPIDQQVLTKPMYCNNSGNPNVFSYQNNSVKYIDDIMTKNTQICKDSPYQQIHRFEETNTGSRKSLMLMNKHKLEDRLVTLMATLHNRTEGRRVENDLAHIENQLHETRERFSSYIYTLEKKSSA